MDQQGGAIERKPANKTRVKVAIRVRPMLPREMVGDYRPCMEIRAKSEILIGTDKQLSSDKNNCREYKYDHVFGEESPQQDVYVQCIRELVLSCFQGYNAAVLAYGQTGSGKTYTMGTAVSTLADPDRIGIIPRVINEIFEQVEERRPQTSITVTASYIQLYNEQIVDLLTDSQLKLKNDMIAIKEDKENGLVNVEGVIKECVTSPQQMLRLLERGGTHRTTKHTNMNDTSSRSHAIFTIYIDSEPIRSEKETNKEETLSGITHSRFFFADLAGSERAKKTGATGDTLKQGININLGLLELGNVISALSTIEKNKDQFITFRNSKLTRILQDALGGNSNTYMIACVSPAQSNYEESLNTLKYASKAMNIKNTPVINRNKNDMLKQQNQQLRMQNRRLKQLLAQKGVRIQLDEDQPPDLVVMQAKILKDQNRMLNRRYNECLVELQKTKHRLNQLEIKIYDIRREKDIMQMKFQELVKEHPLLAEGEIANSLREKFDENQREQVSVVEKYLQNIQILQTKLADKQNLYGQLQTQYNSLLDNSKKDEQILIKKHNLLYAIGKENNKLRQEITRLSQEQGNQTVLQDTTICGDQISEEIETMMLDHAEELEQDEVIQVQQSDYCKRQQQTKEQLSQVDRYILQKQQFLQRISKDQISLQSELISSMKNQYHQKIELLQREKKQLLKLREETGTVQKNKSNNKIENLQNQLKEYRKKAREQGNLQKQVQNKNSKIKTLSDEINKFKMQRMELNRKLKEDKDNFQKLKNKRIKELLIAKKENLKKQNDIRKEKLKNFKYEQNAKKKDQEIKRIKRVNEALKSIVKPSRNTQVPKRDSLTPATTQQTPELKHFDRQQQEFVMRMTKQYLCEIQREQSINQLQRKLAKAEEQLILLLNDDAANKIKLQRIQLKEVEELTEEDIAEKAGLQLILSNYEEEIHNYETYIADLQQSPQHSTPIYFFDIEATVIYNKTYDNVDAMRGFIRALNQAFKNLLYENCHLLGKNRRDETQIQQLRAQIFQQREKIMGLNAQMQRILAQAREEMIMNRYYTAQQPEIVSVGLKRLDDREKKEMERKVQDLAKNNRQLASELQKTRRKCEIVQQKYQSIKNLVSKDKNIGRQEEPNFTKPQKKLEKQASNRQLIDQLDGMIENIDRIDRLKKTKSSTTFEEQANVQPPQMIGQGEGQGSANRWQCIWKEAAHNSGVLSIAVHSNYVISTATKSIKIWDLQSRKMFAELPANAAVKYVMIDPDRRLFFTACQKQVIIWDLISLEVQGILKCHRDEVRAIHTHGDYIFTGGKGSPNGGSLLVWDLRKLNPNQALEEKQKNQDIFALTSNQNVLYYGTRNHSVRRMAIGSWDVLSPFEPPHLDSVTGLTVVGGRLVSGSKDKHLRLWALDHAVNNSKHTFYAFNDYVTTVQGNRKSKIGVPNAPLFYAGSKDGQVKACYVKNDRIQVMGNFLAHTQSVNAVCSLEENPFSLITASQDKMIKIWQPSKETLENVARERYFE